MINIEIREAVPGDEPALAALVQRTWTPDSDVMPRPGADDPFFDSTHPPEQFLVAEQAGRVVGFVRLIQPILFPSGAHVRQVQGLVVDSEERGRGIGRRLIGAACAEARRQGARRITLHVLEPNGSARRLYEAAGFTVEGVLSEEFCIEGRFVDDILMARRLD